MTEERDFKDNLFVGLKKLTEEDIDSISHKAFLLVEEKLSIRVPEREMKYFDVETEISYIEDVLEIGIDIIYNPSIGSEGKEQIISETLQAVFQELDNYLREKYSK